MKHTTVTTRQSARKEGFVILFSIVVSAIVLLISAGVFRIASEEVILSGTSRESLRSFYAADGGIECALGNGVHTAASIPTSVSCAGASHPIAPDGNGNDVFFVSFSDNTCAQVTVTQTVDPATGVTTRELFSRGFNTACDASTGQPDFNYQSLVERTIHVRFLQNGQPANTGTNTPGGSLGGTIGSITPISGTNITPSAVPSSTPDSGSTSLLNLLDTLQQGQ